METTRHQTDGIHGGETDMRGNPKWNYFHHHVVDYQQELLYQSRGPWPTPSPGRPLAEYAEVCNLPREELFDWYRHVSVKYLWIIASRFLPGLWWAYQKSGGRFAEFDDAAFSQHLSHGMYSKFLCPLDPGDVDLFKNQVPDINEDPNHFQKADFSMMEWLCGHTLPGSYTAATLVLFRVHQTETPIPDYQAIAIHLYQVDDRQQKITSEADTLVPAEPNTAAGRRWALAKYYALQGAVHRVNMTEHGRLHFPYDSINAISKSIFPQQHPVMRLLMPHLRLSLVVNNSVLEGKHSLLSRTNWVVYSPFAAEGKYTRRLIPDAYVGRKGKPNAFPPYQFSSQPVFPASSFGQCLARYYGIFHQFVTAVIHDTLPAEYPDDDSSVEKRDWEFVALWAGSIAEWVPGFPKRADLLEEREDSHTIGANQQLLIDTLTQIMWTLTVAHAADHIGFAQAGPTRNVFRLRVPPPLKGVAVPNDFMDKLVSPWDLFQSYLTHQLFYTPHNVVRLLDVSYDFGDQPHAARLQSHQEQFIAELMACDREERQRDPSLFQLADVSSSIQY